MKTYNDGIEDAAKACEEYAKSIPVIDEKTHVRRLSLKIAASIIRDMKQPETLHVPRDRMPLTEQPEAQQVESVDERFTVAAWRVIDKNGAPYTDWINGVPGENVLRFYTRYGQTIQLAYLKNDSTQSIDAAMTEKGESCL